VADQQDTPARMPVVEVGEQRAEPQHDVRPGLAARGPVVELAEPPPPAGLLRQAGFHPGRSEHVQDAELTVAQPLIDQDRCLPAAGLDGEFRGLACAQVGRGPDRRAPAVRVAREEPAQGQRLLPSSVRQSDIRIPGRDVDDMRAGLMSQRGGNVALAFTVPDQQ